MLVPRIIISTVDLGEIESMKDKNAGDLALYLPDTDLERTSALNLFHGIKKMCLRFSWILLLQNVELAALVNADGICCAIDDDRHGRAKDILGEDKLVWEERHIPFKMWPPCTKRELWIL